MHYSQIKESKYLKKEDCGKGILVTIQEVTQENVAKQGDPEELKFCLWFQESEKPLVLNSTNGNIIANITGEEDTDNWAGHKIVLYHDPNIQFAGKLVGGIRVRAPKNQPAQPKPGIKPPMPKLPPSIPVDDPDGDDDPPF